MGFTGYIWQDRKIAWNWLPVACQAGFVVFILSLSINETKTSIVVATAALSCRCRLNLNELCLMVTSTEGERVEEGEEKTIEAGEENYRNREGKRVSTPVYKNMNIIFTQADAFPAYSFTIVVVSSNALLACCFPGTCVIWMAGLCCVSDASDLERTRSPSVCCVLLLFTLSPWILSFSECCVCLAL